MKAKSYNQNPAFYGFFVSAGMLAGYALLSLLSAAA